MKLVKTKLSDVYIINHSPFVDNRGYFSRLFCENEISKKIKFKIKQSNLSFNKSIYTLRGFHYQIGKYSENKIVNCINGAIYDIIVDLRKKSPTYKKFISIIINAKEKRSILIPKGCANAFLTLKKNTTVLYYTSNYYNRNFERGIKYNDINFNFKWPKKPKIISKKDLNYKNYELE